MPSQADRPIRIASVVFFDLETTGLRPDRGARITEMAVVDQEGIRFNWAADAEPPSDADALLGPGRRRRVDDVVGCGRAATSRERRVRAPPAGGFTSLSFLQSQNYFRESLRLHRPSVLRGRTLLARSGRVRECAFNSARAPVGRAPVVSPSCFSFSFVAEALFDGFFRVEA